jgi:membrane protease YdiL (CAAX protease family)
MNRLLLLSIEFAAIFIALPLLIYFRIIPNLPIPYLLAVTLVAFFLLRFQPTFDLSALTSWRAIGSQLPALLLRDALFLALLGFGVHHFAPDLWFSLVKRTPTVWLAIMLLYPLLSVYPQELLYRAFFFHRYQPLFGKGWGMILASALSFAFVHVIFRNWTAVTLCAIGGVLFSLTYRNSGSLLLTSIDHAIFGNFLFTIGLGQFFYHGAHL